MTTDVQIKIPGASLSGKLVKAPANDSGLVILCHGSGSNIRSYRNNAIARYYQQNGISTLLFNILTDEEDHIYNNRFDIDLHTQRIKEVTQWVAEQSDLKDSPIGYFAAGSCFPSAVEAAVSYPEVIKAVVCRGLYKSTDSTYYENMECPTLLIAGGLNENHVKINEEVYKKLNCKKELIIVDGASQQFEENGKLQELAQHSLGWFQAHFNS